MKLYLVRHGDALDSTLDASRPLSKKGQLEAMIVAKFLQKNNIEAEQIYHSGKLRAQQTAESLASVMQSHPQINMLEGLKPDDNVKPIAVYCNHWQQDILLVGHLPFMSKLVSELIFKQDDKLCIDFHTASILCLQRLGIFQWYISWFIFPSLLSAN